MHLFSLLLSTVALSTIILGNPVAEGQLSSSSSSSLDNFFISPFLPQDLQSPPNLNQGIYADAPLGSQSSNGKTLQDFAILDQQIGPNLVFDMALAPNSQGEKIDDETAQYRSFNCNGKYSVCCEGRDRSINSQHMPCPESKQSPHPPPSPSPSPSRSLKPHFWHRACCVPRDRESIRRIWRSQFPKRYALWTILLQAILCNCMRWELVGRTSGETEFIDLFLFLLFFLLMFYPHPPLRF